MVSPLIEMLSQQNLNHWGAIAHLLLDTVFYTVIREGPMCQYQFAYSAASFFGSSHLTVGYFKKVKKHRHLCLISKGVMASCKSYILLIVSLVDLGHWMLCFELNLIDLHFGAYPI